MSQVKNLRAMFEVKDDSTSLPDRGRTPTSGPDFKPLPNRVKANFIAIEKDGRVGLQRDPSGDSSVSQGSPPNTTTESADATAKKVPDKVEPSTAPEEAISRRSPFTSPPKDRPAQSPILPSVEVPAVKSNGTPTQRPADKAKVAVASGTKDDAVNNHLAPSTLGTSALKVGPVKKKPSEVAPKPVTKPATTTTTRPANLTISKPSTRSGSRSPAPRHPTTPSPREPKAPRTAPSSSATTPAKKTTSTVTPRKNATAAAPQQKKTPSSGARKPPPIQMSPLTSGIGFVKPKPKSPTKPVRLPSSLTAHTAASGSKTSSNPRLSGGSAGGSSVQSLPRSSSRTSTATSGNLRREPSNPRRSRPSVGPPPKNPTSQDRPANRNGKAVDEGFLTRMMRPTQSSQSKTADKGGPSTPPRRVAVPTRPATRQDDRSRRREGSRARPASSNARRLVSRSASPARTSTANKPAKEVAKAEPIKEMVDTMETTAEKDAPTKPVEPMEVAEPIAPVATPKAPEEQVEVVQPQQADEPKEADPTLVETPAASSPGVDAPVQEDLAGAEPTAEVAEVEVAEAVESKTTAAATATAVEVAAETATENATTEPQEALNTSAEVEDATKAATEPESIDVAAPASTVDSDEAAVTASELVNEGDVAASELDNEVAATASELDKEGAATASEADTQGITTTSGINHEEATTTTAVDAGPAEAKVDDDEQETW